MELKLLSGLSALESWLVRNQFNATKDSTLKNSEEWLQRIRFMRMMMLNVLHRLELVDAGVLKDCLVLRDRPSSQQEDENEEDELNEDSLFAFLTETVLELLARMAMSLDKDTDKTALLTQGQFELKSLLACYWTARLCERFRFLCKREADFFAKILSDWMTTGKRDLVEIITATISVTPFENEELREEFNYCPADEISTAEMFSLWNKLLEEIAVLESMLEEIPNLKDNNPN